MIWENGIETCIISYMKREKKSFSDLKKKVDIRIRKKEIISFGIEAKVSYLPDVSMFSRWW